MKINEIIREKRKEQSLTQEQVAEYLGISPPAVNKWEKGNSYPDITLLPALARLLKTDLNTLLSFNEDLTELEIGNFEKEIVNIVIKDGFHAGFQSAMKKIEEYPNCELLILRTALTLDGAMLMFPVENSGAYREKIEKIYERIAKSENQKIHNLVSSVLISRYMEREELEKAEELIDGLPDDSFDKTPQQANLYIKQERFSEAAKLIEFKLMNMAAEIHSALFKLMEIALKENRHTDAQYYADISEKTVKLFDLVDYSAYYAHFQLAVMKNDIDESIAILKSMLPAMKKKWDVKNSPLYRHMEPSTDGIIHTRLLPTTIESLQTDKEFEFLWNNIEFKELLRQYPSTGTTSIKKEQVS